MIELMLVVAIIGILASLAIPTFSKYKEETFKAESSMVIGSLHRGVVAYFNDEQLIPSGGPTPVALTNCFVAQDLRPDLSTLTDSPAGSKFLVPFSTSPSFTALGITDDLYSHAFFIAGDAGCDLGSYGIGRVPDGTAVQALVSIRKVGDDSYKVGAIQEYINKGDLVRTGGMLWYGPMSMANIGALLATLGS